MRGYRALTCKNKMPLTISEWRGREHLTQAVVTCSARNSYDPRCDKKPEPAGRGDALIALNRPPARMTQSLTSSEVED